MRQPTRVGFVVGAIIALGLTFSVGSANADHLDPFYYAAGQWDPSDTPDIDAGSMQNIFDGSAAKKRRTGRDITAGEAQWNAAASNFNFGLYLGMNPSIVQQSCAEVPLHRARWFTDYQGWIPNNFLAFWSGCQDTGLPHSDFSAGAIWIRLASPTTEFKIGGGSVPSHRIDFRSVATHELGHATGWIGHWPENLEECASLVEPRQTMCPTILQGQTFMRTTESHDESVIDYYYDTQ